MENVRHHHMLLYIFILSWCHKSLSYNYITLWHNIRRQNSITFLCCRLFANKWGGLVCGGATLSEISKFVKYLAIVQHRDSSANKSVLNFPLCIDNDTTFRHHHYCTIVCFHFVTVSQRQTPGSERLVYFALFCFCTNTYFLLLPIQLLIRYLVFSIGIWYISMIKSRLHK